MSRSSKEDHLGHSHKDDSATQPLTRTRELAEVSLISESPHPPELFCRSSTSTCAIERWLEATSASPVHPVQPEPEASSSLQQPLEQSSCSNKRKRSHSPDDAPTVKDGRCAHPPLTKQHLTQYLSASKSELGVSWWPVLHGLADTFAITAGTKLFFFGRFFLTR